MSENAIEKFEGILKSISEVEYTEERIAEISEAFDVAENEKLLTFIKFLSAPEFKGKISLANFKKQTEKCGVPYTDSLSVYCKKNPPPSKEFMKIINSFESVKNRGTFKKSTFRQLIYMSKMKRKLLYDPQMYFLNKFALLDLITKFAILDVFAYWKNNKYLSSSIVDNLSYRSFTKRINPTFKAILKKILNKYQDIYTADYAAGNVHMKIKNILINNFYNNNFETIPNFNITYDFSYNINDVQASYNNAFKYLLGFRSTNERSYRYITVFDFVFLRYKLTKSFNSMFSVSMNMNNGYGTNIIDNMSNYHVQLSNERYFSLNPILRINTNNDSGFLDKLGYLKNIFGSIEDSLSLTLENLNDQIVFLKQFYKEQFIAINLVNYLKFLESYLSYYTSIHYFSTNELLARPTINGIFFSYIKDMNLILSLDADQQQLRFNVNNPLMLFIVGLNDLANRPNRSGLILDSVLYLNDSTNEQKVNSIVYSLKAVIDFTDENENLFSGSQIRSIGNIYNKYLSELPDELKVAFDLTDKLLFFRHFSEFMVNTISLIDSMFDVSKYSLIEKALEIIDGERNV